jgi:hypothetical protein
MPFKNWFWKPDATQCCSLPDSDCTINEQFRVYSFAFPCNSPTYLLACHFSKLNANRVMISA